MAKEGLELKVGVFVLVSLAVLAWLVFKAGEFQTAPGYSVRFIFSSVRGVENGSAVRLAGVTVGEVRRIHVAKTAEGQTQVEVTARIQQDVTIAEDAIVRIGSLGFLGEKFIEILPGTSAQSLPVGGEIFGKTPIEMEDVAESGQQLIATVDSTIANINEVMGDPKFKQSFKNTFGQAEAVTQNLKEASENLKAASGSAKIILGRLENGEGSVGRLLKNDKMAKDLESVAADLKAAAADLKAHPWKLFKRS